MDTPAIILCLIMLAVIAIVVIVSVKKKDTSDKTEITIKTIPPDEPDPEPVVVPETDPVREGSPSSPQVYIYTFVRKNPYRRCPFCDGEIAADARICSICGRNL